MSSSSNEVTKKMKNRDKWYGDAAEFWENVDPSVSGMLQGFERISDIDVLGSKEFLEELQEENILKSKLYRAADCGAGIGRVSKHFLMNHFDVVDIVEPCEKFTNEIHTYLADEKLSLKVGKIFNEGLQAFTPKHKHYDVIWIQWVVGYLTDEDFVTFLLRCKEGLTDDGCIVIKDNLSRYSPVLDEEDSSVTRTYAGYKKIFDTAGMTLRKRVTQKDFPSQLFGVHMFALT